MSLSVSSAILEETLAALRSSKDTESVALWLAKNSERGSVNRCYVPEHVARADMFQLTPKGMSELRRTLRENRLFIAAQLHTHPFEAFHSKADDRWALIRHLGALSIVLPNFAQSTTGATFASDSAVYVMTEDGRWSKVPLHEHLQGS
jgi:hypothetical protein